MKDEILRSLPEVLQKHCSTLKKTSIDGKKNMTESLVKVVNYDKIPNEFARGKGGKGIPTSVDALYVDETGKWIFIEFKNGSIAKADIFRKIYDSILIGLQMGFLTDMDFVRSKVEYILVYNSEKYGEMQNAPARDTNYNYIFNRAQAEQKLFDVDKLEGHLLKETHTFTKEMFEEKFVKKMEQTEHNE